MNKKYFILSLVCIFSDEAMGMGEETSRTFQIKGSSLKKSSQAPKLVPVTVEEEIYSEPEKEIYYNGKHLYELSVSDAMKVLEAKYDQSGRPLKSH